MAAHGVRDFVRRHRLGVFYALTFAISWGYWIPDAVFGGHLSHVPGLLGPLLAAFIVTGAADGNSGLADLVSRMLRWRVRPKWYGWAVTPLAVAICAAAILSLGSAAFPGPAKWERMNGFPSIGIFTIGLILIVNAFGEETGWRGFALPQFRKRYGEMKASLLVFVPWALWHLPTFFIDSGYRDFPIFVLPGFLIGLLAGSVVLTWMYEGARSSILIVALWHLCLNLGSATPAGEATGAIVTMCVIVWAIFVARSWRSRGSGSEVSGDRRSRPASLGPSPRASS
jgi:membrane protease YdiL (CAAX protease family)